MKEKGSTFYVNIPYKPANRKDNASPDRSEGKTNTAIANENYTILVAEDEQVNYLYIEAIFEEKKDINFTLIHAKNGKESVDICLNNKNIDLVLMDIKMPLMSGHEASEKIKSVFPNLPIIAQTAYSTESDRKLALKHGCDDYISKPLNKELLFNLIDKYLKVK